MIGGGGASRSAAWLPRAVRLAVTALAVVATLPVLSLALIGLDDRDRWAGERTGRVQFSDDGVNLRGRIVPAMLPGFVAKLATALLVDGRGRAVLSLDSPGGNLDVALRMRAVIRLLQQVGEIDTRVAAGASCQSACTVLFAAGGRREAAATAQFMFHGVRWAAPPARPSRDVRHRAAIEARYLAALGEADAALARRLKLSGTFDGTAATFMSARDLAAVGRMGGFITALTD